MLIFQKKRRLFFVLTASLCLWFVPESGRAETAVIQIQHRWASEALPLIHHFLSSAGVATVDERTNSVIIIDSGEVIKNIQHFLQQYDAPAKRVRIRLRLNDRQSSRGRSLSAEGGASGQNWGVFAGNEKKEGVDVRINESKSDSQRTSEYVVSTTSGNTAYILTGKEVPYRDRWRDYCRRYGGCPETMTFQKIDTGMEIRPVIVGDRATIEITPRISDVTSGDPHGVVRFSAASTRLSVPLGQWVTFGGVNEKGNQVLSEILGRSSGKQRSFLSMSVMVETY